MRMFSTHQPAYLSQNKRKQRRAWLFMLGGLCGIVVLMGSIWRATSAAPQARETVVISLTHYAGLGGAATFSPDGTSIVGTDWGELKFWNRVNGLLVRSIPLAQWHLNHVVYSRDGRHIAVAGPKTWILDAHTFTTTLRIGTATEDPNKLADTTQYVTFSPDGTSLAVTSSFLTRRSSSPIRIYETATGKLVTNISVPPRQTADAFHVAFSPDGTSLLTAGHGNAAMLWDSISGQQLQAFPNTSSLMSDVAFSPDGQMIALANDDTTVTVWETRTGNLLRTIKISSIGDRLMLRRPYAHDHNWTSCVTFSPDGKRIAAGGTDASAGVWDVATGEQVYALNGHTDQVWSIAFSSDGNQVVTSGRDKTIRVWSIGPERSH